MNYVSQLLISLFFPYFHKKERKKMVKSMTATWLSLFHT